MANNREAEEAEAAALSKLGMSVARTFLTSAADWLAGRATITVVKTVDQNGRDSVTEIGFKSQAPAV